MGALEDIGAKGETLYASLVSSIAKDIENKEAPRVPFLDDFRIGFEVTGGGKKAADAWKEKALEEDSAFRKNFFDSGFLTIFDLIDSIPAINIIAPITDPTSALLPITNAITDILAGLGIENPNQFFLTKIDQIIKKKEELLGAISKLKETGEDAIEEGIQELAEIFNEIDPDLSIETLKSKVQEKIEDIKSAFIPEVELPEPPYFQLPDISDLKSFGLSFFNFPIPEIEGIDPSDVIELYFNFDLEIPPIGVIFVEIAKVKIKMLLELAAGIPPFLKTAIDKIKELFPLNFNLKEIIKAVFDAVVNTFFDKLLQSDKIKKLIEKASTMVYIINNFIKSLVIGLVVSIVGVIFGKGLIMKSTAIALGLLK